MHVHELYLKRSDYICTFLCFIISDPPENTNLTTTANTSATLKNSNVTFTCTAEGSPSPDYRFFHDDTLLGNSSSGTFQTLVTKSGLYSCVPVNKAGEGQKRSVTITVVGELFGFMCLYKSSLSCCDRKLFILRSSCFILQCTIVSDW